MNKHLIIALTVTYIAMFGLVVWWNWEIDKTRTNTEKEYTCLSLECTNSKTSELPEYSENVIKYEDGSIYNPVTKKSYCTPQSDCSIDNFKKVTEVGEVCLRCDANTLK